MVNSSVTAAGFLGELYRHEVSIRVIGDKLRVKAPEGILTPERRASLVSFKAELMKLVPLAREYRASLRRAFALMLAEAKPEEFTQFLDDQARYTDELGPALARLVARNAGLEWRQQTDVCPWCDAAGKCHEPKLDD